MNQIFTAIVPVVPMRKENRDASEMVTQLLFGEQCEVLDKKQQWVQVKSIYDGYMGWVDEKQIGTTKNSYILLDNVVTSLYLHGKSFTSNENLLLSAGAEIKTYLKRKDAFFFNGVEFQIIAGNYKEVTAPLNLKETLKLAHEFINVPYLWGGRSSMGIDCSGFTQVLFKLRGIKLPRDASQQITFGNEVEDITDVQPCDLAFFGKESDKITHVGMLLDKQTIIHASGKVRVDRFDEKGIFNTVNKKLTHRLHKVKRVV